MSGLKRIAFSGIVTILFSTFQIQGKGNTGSLPFTSPVIGGYSAVDSIEKRISASGPHRIEGLWQFQADGSTIAIEREEKKTNDVGLSYRMVVVRSSNRLLRPGTLIGTIVPSGKGDVFEAKIYSTDADGGKLRNPKSYTLSLTDESSRLIFKKVKSRYIINLWRMLPYMWRGTMRLRDTGGEAPNGCVKIFPVSSHAAEPRYL